MQIFDIRFFIDLHVLGCPEQDLTIFGKCLSVCVSICVWQKFCGNCISRTNAQNFIKLKNLYGDVNKCECYVATFIISMTSMLNYWLFTLLRARRCKSQAGHQCQQIQWKITEMINLKLTFGNRYLMFGALVIIYAYFSAVELLQNILFPN